MMLDKVVVPLLVQVPQVNMTISILYDAYIHTILNKSLHCFVDKKNIIFCYTSKIAHSITLKPYDYCIIKSHSITLEAL